MAKKSGTPRRIATAVARTTFGLSVLFCLMTVGSVTVTAQQSDVELRDEIKQAMTRGCDYLRRNQLNSGAWVSTKGAGQGHTIGTTAMAILAQLNCDVPVTAPHIQRGLEVLRNLPPHEPELVYEMSLVIMTLVAAEEYDKDLPRIRILARMLEDSQIVEGGDAGLWGYNIKGSRGFGQPDRSNGQFAILALRDAAQAGVEVSRSTWKRTYDHWIKGQSADGGWCYHTGGSDNSGSMTVAGLSTIATTSRMLQDDSDVDADGRPDCCRVIPPNVAMQRGRQWLAERFSVNSNPGSSNWHYYYLYGLERAGRLSNVRYFGRYDWYRQGARYFVGAQQASGHWISTLGGEGGDELTSTSMALLFLSKGLSRVVVNKLDYTSPDGDSLDTGEWNRHSLDMVNLIDHIDGLPGWPARLTSQTLTLSRLKPETAVQDMNQAPVLFITGREAPQFSDQQVSWLREYIDEGGFIFAVGNCDGQGFDGGFRKLVERMFPRGDTSLQRLISEHPVYRSEFLLNAEGVELWGVDFGCRTSIIYCPEDIGCLWQKWQRHEPPNRHRDLSQRIVRGTRIGVNVLAYATGREPPEKLSENTVGSGNKAALVERGLLEVAQLTHTGGWDTAPKALGNLLRALNETVGLTASDRGEAIAPTLDQMTRFPLVYMHGRYRYQLKTDQIDSIRDYLSRGGVLFADACCGSTSFDRSFRDMVKQIFPDTPLKDIPADHEMYSEKIGHNISSVTRRRLIPGSATASMQVREENGPPLLEGLEIDGRLAIIYSRYDISCALEQQASLACDGYIEADAVRIAVNVVLYAMLQDINWSKSVRKPTGE